ncbi:MAG TPA: nucleoside transporter C-terminal domain-containing protein [Myxococcota bacterium]|nr:nucleoside transporter C-terminal domain-containing protein [Myxococcota bacterium]
MLFKSQELHQSLLERSTGILGIIFILLVAWLMSTNRRGISWRVVIYGIALQFLLAIVVLKTHVGRLLFDGANDVVVKILSFSVEGSRFVFGNLVALNVPVGIPASVSAPAHMADLSLSGAYANTGAYFAFAVLPTIIFFSALTAILYYFGILQFIVRGISRCMQSTLGTSGAESFSTAANIFLGQTEAPLLVKPFLHSLTKSEIMAVMTGGFATVSGGVLVAFVGMLVANFPDIAGHLLAASVMSAPAALVVAKMMVPETEVPLTLSTKKIDVEITDTNVFDAATRGTSDGLYLCLNVAAMLIAFVALIALVNWLLGALGSMFGTPGLSLDLIFSFFFSPFAFLLGVPWEDATTVGKLLGVKTAINEFVAYLNLADLLEDGVIKNAKSAVIATYALCGFANFASIGVQIGGLSALAPSRRQDFAVLGFRAMVAGTLACLLTAAIAGILL